MSITLFSWLSYIKVQSANNTAKPHNRRSMQITGNTNKTKVERNCMKLVPVSDYPDNFNIRFPY